MKFTEGNVTSLKISTSTFVRPSEILGDATCDRFGGRSVLSPIYLLRSLGLVFVLTGVLQVQGKPDEGYVGAEACAKCHAGIQHEWEESRHGRMMQPATGQSVKGDFAQGKVV